MGRFVDHFFYNTCRKLCHILTILTRGVVKATVYWGGLVLGLSHPLLVLCHSKRKLEYPHRRSVLTHKTRHEDERNSYDLPSFWKQLLSSRQLQLSVSVPEFQGTPGVFSSLWKSHQCIHDKTLCYIHDQFCLVQTWYKTSHPCRENIFKSGFH